MVSGKQGSPTHGSSQSAWGMHGYHKKVTAPAQGLLHVITGSLTLSPIYFPRQPKIFPCVVSEESLMSLGRNTPFEIAVPPKLSHPTRKRDCLQLVVLPE